jgi:hypothetical protein
MKGRLIAGVLAIALGLTGCVNDRTAEVIAASANSTAETTVTTTTTAAASAIPAEKTFPIIDGSTSTIKDIALSVPLAKEQEAYAGENNFKYEAVPVALEGFVFLVNPENPVQSLTQDQIRKIY